MHEHGNMSQFSYGVVLLHRCLLSSTERDYLAGHSTEGDYLLVFFWSVDYLLVMVFLSVGVVPSEVRLICNLEQTEPTW